MAGQKRTRSGAPKAQTAPQPPQPQDTSMSSTPPCGQALPSSKGKTTDAPAGTAAQTNASRANPPKSRTAPARVPSTQPHTKRPRLPPNATISKRPLLHPSIASPFASAETPKVLYITRTAPFIPAVKRIRALLGQIDARASQSSSAGRGGGKGMRGKANGRLAAADVEASVAAAAGRGRPGVGAGEEVLLKATGRAIPRALELGVRFQGEPGCRVRVETGSVRAIDDVAVAASLDGEGGEEGGEDEEEVPETRIRVLSTVTVRIGLL